MRFYICVTLIRTETRDPLGFCSDHSFQVKQETLRGNMACVLFNTNSWVIQNIAQRQNNQKKTLKSTSLCRHVLHFLYSCTAYQTIMLNLQRSSKSQGLQSWPQIAVINSHFILLLDQCLVFRGQGLQFTFFCHMPNLSTLTTVFLLTVTMWRAYASSCKCGEAPQQLLPSLLTQYPVEPECWNLTTPGMRCIRV